MDTDQCICNSIEIIRTHEGNVCAECGKLRQFQPGDTLKAMGKY